MNLSTREAPVLRAVLQLLALRGLPTWRMNSGALRNAANRPVRFGFAGCPDVWALGSGGRLILIEVKRPGGKLTSAQRIVLERARAAGAVALVVDDVAVLARALDRLAADPAIDLDLDGSEAT